MLTVPNPQKIIYIEAHSNYSMIVYEGGQIFTSRTLKYWNEYFNNVKFLRIHSKYLVNAKKIVNLNLQRKVMTIEGNNELPCSRRFKARKIMTEL